MELLAAPPMPPKARSGVKLREGGWTREQVKEFKQLAVKLARKQLKLLGLDAATFKAYNADACRLACKLAQAAGQAPASWQPSTVKGFVVQALNKVEEKGIASL